MPTIRALTFPLIPRAQSGVWTIPQASSTRLGLTTTAVSSANRVICESLIKSYFDLGRPATHLAHIEENNVLYLTGDYDAFAASNTDETTHELVSDLRIRLLRPLTNRYGNFTGVQTRPPVTAYAPKRSVFILYKTRDV